MAFSSSNILYIGECLEYTPIETSKNPLILKNDDISYTAPSATFSIEIDNLCSQSSQPFQVDIDVGTGCSLPQMASNKGDVNQFSPSKGEFKNEQEMFVPYYDPQMRAFRTGEQTFDFGLNTQLSRAIPSGDLLLTEKQIEFLMLNN